MIIGIELCMRCHSEKRDLWGKLHDMYRFIFAIANKVVSWSNHQQKPGQEKGRILKERCLSSQSTAELSMWS
uniref:Arf-GAP domain-containing protein n=1 Tax=Steinernema glaseri TaxID=37863 RepID=A0A1I7YSS2_9BILA